MSRPDVIIRQETEKDFDQVYRVVKDAFASAEYSDGDEQDLVVRLRKSAAFIPELSLVAEVEGKVVGHIMFTKLKAGDKTQLCLAPLSVLPAYQNQGIGGLLIKKGHDTAKNLDYEFSLVIGYPQYYSRFGYVDAGSFGFRPPFELPQNVFMACRLQNGLTDKSVKSVEYPKEFFEKG